MGDNSFPFLFLVIFIVFFCFVVWFLIDSYLISRFDGKIKRGVKIWRKELPYNSRNYLLGLNKDVVEYEKVLFSNRKSAFIRIQEGEVLIFSTPRYFHSSWSYVGYIDLTSPFSELEYRTSLPGIIFLIPFTIFGIIIFVINYFIQTKAIDSFLERKTMENLILKEKRI